MQHRFLKGILPRKYKKQMLNAPALIPISSGESIPGELLLSRAHFRFDSIAKFETLNYIYKLLKKAATYTITLKRITLLNKVQMNDMNILLKMRLNEPQNQNKS
jgi:hypothetical protein